MYEWEKSINCKQHKKSVIRMKKKKRNSHAAVKNIPYIDHFFLLFILITLLSVECSHKYFIVHFPILNFFSLSLESLTSSGLFFMSDFCAHPFGFSFCVIGRKMHIFHSLSWILYWNYEIVKLLNFFVCKWMFSVMNLGIFEGTFSMLESFSKEFWVLNFVEKFSKF